MTAKDCLFLGYASDPGATVDTETRKLEFHPVVMEHAVGGCGTSVRQWGERSLEVAHGSISRPGEQVILDWEHIV